MTNFSKNNSRLVYSSEKGRICPECGNPAGKCSCRKNKQQPRQSAVNDGIVRLRRETKGRKGKGVTLISGTGLEQTELKQLAKRLKAKCGSGGTVKNNEIEIQGDHRLLLEQELVKEGFTVEQSGG
jgi:translation initiation factor 1